MRARGINHRAVIELLGDQGEVARALGVRRRNNIAHWKRRGIPPAYWLSVAALARARGYAITAEQLARGAPGRRLRRLRPRLPDELEELDGRRAA